MDDDEFERLVSICRIPLSGAERERMRRDIGEILEYFDTVEAVDCDDYAPSYQPVKIPGKKRPDKVAPFKDADRLLENSRIYRFYVVGPKI